MDIEVTIDVDMTFNGKPADAARVALWVGEALNSPDVRDSRMEIVVKHISVDAK